MILRILMMEITNCLFEIYKQCARVFVWYSSLSLNNLNTTIDCCAAISHLMAKYFMMLKSNWTHAGLTFFKYWRLRLEKKTRHWSMSLQIGHQLELIPFSCSVCWAWVCFGRHSAISGYHIYDHSFLYIGNYDWVFEPNDNSYFMQVSSWADTALYKYDVVFWNI